MEDTNFTLFPQSGDIQDLREKNILTTTTFINQLKTKPRYRINHDKELNLTMIIFNAPWQLPTQMPIDLIQVFDAFDVERYFSDEIYKTNFNYKINDYLDKLIFAIEGYLIKDDLTLIDVDQGQWQSNLNYISQFTIWRYIYNQFSGGIKSADPLINIAEKRNINELTSYIVQNLSCNRNIPNETMILDNNLMIYSPPLKRSYVIQHSIPTYTLLSNLNNVLYDIYWHVENQNSLEVPWTPPLVNDDFQNSGIIAMHVYDHFNHSHIRRFRQLDELFYYYITKIYATWRDLGSSNKGVYDRYYHGIVNNLNHTKDEILQQPPVKMLYRLHILQGLPPLLSASTLSLNRFCLELIKLLSQNELTDWLIYLGFNNNISFQHFPMIKVVFDVLFASSIGRRLRLNWIKLLPINVEIIPYNAFPTHINYSRTILIKELPNYSKPLINEFNCVEMLSDIKFISKVYLDKLLNVYSINGFGSFSTQYIEDIDKNLQSQITIEYKLREVLKSSFDKAKSPAELVKLTELESSGYSYSTEQKLILSAYCYKDDINFITRNSDDLEIARFSGIINDGVNSSTLKLLLLFLHCVTKEYTDWSYILNKKAICLFGAIIEPMRDILRRITLDNYVITGFGDNAMSPNFRSDISGFIPSQRFHFIISDIDQTSYSSFDEMVLGTFELLTLIFETADEGFIIKINYLTLALIDKLNLYLKDKAVQPVTIVYTDHSPYGSYEVFFTGFGSKIVGQAIDKKDVTLYLANMLTFASYDISFEKFLFQLPNNQNQRAYDNQTFGDFKSGYYYIEVDSNSLGHAINYYENISTEIAIGNTIFGDLAQTSRLIGMSDMRRMIMSAMVKVYGTSNNKFNNVSTMGLISGNLNVQCKAVSPAKSFSNGQRLAAGMFFTHEYYDKITHVLDVGCRSYECLIIILNLNYKKIKYYGYDSVNLGYRFPRDSNIHFNQQTYTVQNIITLFPKFKRTLVFCYNSLFMTYVSQSSLITDLKLILNEFKKARDSNAFTFMVLTIYVCDPSLEHLYRQLGNYAKNDEEILFTLDTGDPVATLTPEQVKTLFYDESDDGYYNQIASTKTQLFQGNILGGALASGISLSNVAFYNCTQQCFILATDVVDKVRSKPY
ncbi:Inner core protein [Wuhan heteroptera virus 3]|uniref:Inner core protein n=1 Tax=Wuhan heteroptera virus 3 TaxID=1923703 RepID=UPI00090A14DB|nr:Inner core protein [Wuhan heteroptera virus 3]APG79069.1 Inner core protein [Wuhan heteroptera virus 3]APG79205.1 Inner core protein [Wuhan heteroptera virus 3]